MRVVTNKFAEHVHELYVQAQKLIGNTQILLKNAPNFLKNAQRYFERAKIFCHHFKMQTIWPIKQTVEWWAHPVDRTPELVEISAGIDAFEDTPIRFHWTQQVVHHRVTLVT